MDFEKMFTHFWGDKGHSEYANTLETEWNNRRCLNDISISKLDENNRKIEAYIPGFKADEIIVKIIGNQLYISAGTNTRVYKNTKSFNVQIFPEDEINEVSLENGVLTILMSNSCKANTYPIGYKKQYILNE